MAEETQRPLLADKADDEAGEVADNSYEVWRSDLWDVCKLAGPACLQLFFQVRTATSRASRTLP